MCYYEKNCLVVLTKTLLSSSQPNISTNLIKFLKVFFLLSVVVSASIAKITAVYLSSLNESDLQTQLQNQIIIISYEISTFKKSAYIISNFYSLRI